MKTEHRKLITKAYDALYILDNQNWTSYRQQLFELCQKEEREHRGSRSGFGASVADCARMFTVRDIAEYLLFPKRAPKTKDFLKMRRSCFMAAALVATYRKEIRKAWKGQDIAAIAALDYCQIIKTPELYPAETVNA